MKESANGKRTIVLIAVAVIAVCMVMASNFHETCNHKFITW